MKEIKKILDLFLEGRKIVTDSRKIESGCLFFALRGERFDGNEFAAEALEQGADFSIIDNPTYKTSDQTIIVEDVLTALQNLATAYRRTFEIPILAITGSNGKTTTKELIYQVLQSQYRTHATPGNFNNHIGVPLTLMMMPKDTEIAIIEMGANHVGEIEQLCEIAEPTHGLITNIGKAHLEGFGGVEGIKKGKSELYRFLATHKGVAFVNEDEQFLTELSKQNKFRLFYKQSAQLDVDSQHYQTTLVSEKPFVQAKFKDLSRKNIVVDSNLIGIYNFNNIMTAITVGRYFKVDSEKIQKAIATYTPANNRSEIREIDSNHFILDAYNANPISMEVALKYFDNLEAKYKIAVLGGMKEMGAYSVTEHKKLLDLAIASSVNELWLIGEEFALLKDNYDKNIYWFDDVADTRNYFLSKRFENTHFLVKGSRSNRLEKILA